MAMRALAVAHLCSRLIDEPDFQHVLAATLDAGAGAGGSCSSRRGKGAASSSSSSSAAAAAAVVPPHWAAIRSYLTGMLSAKALADSQYAGALEIAAIAQRLQRRVVVLIESDNREDTGGVYPSFEETASTFAGTNFDVHPPLVVVNTRRRHMYPVIVAPSDRCAKPLSKAEVVDALRAVMAALEAAKGSGEAAEMLQPVIAALEPLMK